MAPTEILAFQHYANVQRLLESYGIYVGLYTGSKKFTKPKKGDESKEGIPQVIVGTHALLSEKLAVEDVGLIIVDEQQRFGVEQRSVLRSKAKVPHFLTMTATPIPRTVALTLYGDLDLSIIDELPKGRREIKTHVIPKKKREDAYVFLHKQVKEGDQVYIITPLIEVSETLLSAKAAIHEFERLQKEIFPDLRMGLLHGRLKPKEKDQVLQDFKNHLLDILVSTTVIEVGVDVPNATIMLIENAERFGLAQLHQLRGRVGRGGKQSYCLLFSGVEENETYNRLKNLETISDGLKLAELDLKIRGSGQIFGKEQSGRVDLKIASFADLELIEKTRNAARKLLIDDPTLEKHQLINQELSKIAAQAAPD
jgi:ATP-dependent DNA helicase RecG